MRPKWTYLLAGAAACALLLVFAACGASDNKDKNNDKTGTLNFATDIAPILASSCSGSDCHSSGSGYTEYVGSEANLKARKTDVKTRLGLATGNSLAMPKSPDAKGVVRTISDTDRAKIITFVDQ